MTRCEHRRRRASPWVAGVVVACLAAAAGPGCAPEATGDPAPGGEGGGGGGRRGDAAGGWAPADPGHRWSFPRDHHAHRAYRNEWWYFTGLLDDPAQPGRRLGYQLTFFRVGLVREPPPLDSGWAAGDAVMGHAAVTDLATGAHVFSEVIWRAAGSLGGFGAPGDPALAHARAPPGSAGRWELRLDANGGFVLAARDDAKGLALALTARPTRPPVLQGPNGYSRKSAREGYASLYYSFTRLATAGTVTLGGRTAAVAGTSWMDRELGSSQLAPEQVGWDWWSLRLADGRDLTLYALRGADGEVDFRRGTIAAPGGEVVVLGPDGFTAEPRATWRSARTGAVYPSGWRVRVPAAGLDVRVEPELAAAENASALLPGLSYWEGPVRVVDGEGRRVGEGYAELTGYVRGGRLPL